MQSSYFKRDYEGLVCVCVCGGGGGGGGWLIDRDQS